MEASGINAGSLSPIIKRAPLTRYALRGSELWHDTKAWLGADIEAYRKPGRCWRPPRTKPPGWGQ